MELLALDDLGPDVAFDQATDTAQHWAVVGEREQDSLGGLIPCLFEQRSADPLFSTKTKILAIAQLSSSKCSTVWCTVQLAKIPKNDNLGATRNKLRWKEGYDWPCNTATRT